MVAVGDRIVPFYRKFLTPQQKREAKERREKMLARSELPPPTPLKPKRKRRPRLVKE
jgi:hypothetical protein